MIKYSYVTARQKDAFVNLLRFLFINNLYYREALNSINIINTKEINFNAYSLLPHISKAKILEIGSNFYSETVQTTFYELTSGTSGVPFKCYKTCIERQALALETWKKRRKWDTQITPSNFFQLMGVNRKYGLDFADFSNTNIKKIFKIIESIQPRWLCGSPTTIFNYCKKIEEGVFSPISSIQFIELQGEYVDKSTKKYIENTMHCKTITHYGNRECWAIAYECPEGHMHLQDNIIAETDQISSNCNQLVITSLVNKYMPIVKYATNDIVNILKSECTCGNQTSIIELEGGRQANVIKGYDVIGDILFKKIVHNTINKHQINLDIIRRFRVVQNSYDKFTYYIDTGKDFKKSIISEIYNRTIQKLGSHITIDFKLDYLKTEGKHSIFEICF